jgi:hypothetical protein
MLEIRNPILNAEVGDSSVPARSLVTSHLSL